MRELGWVSGAMTLALVVLYFGALKDIKPKSCIEDKSYTAYEKCGRDRLRISGNKKLKGERVVTVQRKVEEKPDLFKMVRQTWQGCGACHGQKGEGGVGPKLAGQTADYIATALTQYKNKQKRGRKSQMMYGQASALSNRQIDMIAELVETELK